MTQTHTTPSRPARRWRRAFVIFVTLGFLAAACASDSDTITLGDDGGLDVPGGDGGTVDSEAVGTGVDFTYADFDGTKRKLSDLPDGPVVLNFFASWCPTCIAEMPDFETVHQTFGDRVNFIGLATQDRVENAVLLVEDTGITYTVGNDQNGNVFSIFEGLGMPTTVFIDADRNVTRVHTGVLDVESLTDTINSDLLS